MIGENLSHYIIIEKLDEGGMGEVYKAEDTKLKRTVALKFLPSLFSYNSEAKKRFIHEAQSASALDHPNICTIYEIGESGDGKLFISMPSYDGETLKERIKKRLLDVEETVNITLQICEGLNKAHQNDIVHRDIKPANIFITKDGIVKILDFGLAKVKGQTRLTQVGTTAGTVDYMSPEQARGEEVDQRTDIWALGIVMHEMLTGSQPFKADYEQAVIYSILNDEPDLNKISEEIRNILKKTIAKSPSERYQNVKEIMTDLTELKKGSKEESLKPGRFNLKTKLIAVGILIIIFAAVLYFNIKGSFKTQAALPERKMIVVLPFENLGQSDDEYFAQGIREEISNKLASFGNLGVISRNSAEKFAKSDKSTKEIGKALSVDYIVEGTLQWAKGKGKASRVRIIPQLIRVSDDINIWSDSYDRVLNDIFDVQNEIAQKVVEKLGVKLLSNKSISLKPLTKNIEAYDYYLKALPVEYNSVSNSDNLRCIKLYEKAIELDSNFAPAHARISIVYMGLYSYGDKNIKYLEKISKHLRKAIEINPNLAEVHIAQGDYYYFLTNEDQLALQEFKKALEIQPNNTDAIYSISSIYWREGKFDMDLKYTLMAFSLDPMVASYANSIGNSYNLLRNYTNAEKYLERAIDLNPTNSSFKVVLAQNYLDWKGNTRLAWQSVKNISDDEYLENYNNIFIYLNILDRNYDAALKQLKTSKKEYANNFTKYIPNSQVIALIYRYKKEAKLSKIYFDSSRIKLEKIILTKAGDFRFHQALAITYAGLGEKEKALAEINKAVELIPVDDLINRKYANRKYMAQIYTLTGDYKNALKNIDFLLANPNSTKISVNIVKLDPIFDPLRSLPGYKSMIAKYSKDKSF